jgi:hypothetical protein
MYVHQQQLVVQFLHLSQQPAAHTVQHSACMQLMQRVQAMDALQPIVCQSAQHTNWVRRHALLNPLHIYTASCTYRQRGAQVYSCSTHPTAQLYL